MTDEISIDRLVLDVDGLTAQEAEELAQQIGAGLAARAESGGSFDALSVTLDAEALRKDANGAAGMAAGKDVPRLANMIVSSLLRQMV